MAHLDMKPENFVLRYAEGDAPSLGGGGGGQAPTNASDDFLALHGMGGGSGSSSNSSGSSSSSGSRGGGSDSGSDSGMPSSLSEDDMTNSLVLVDFGSAEHFKKATYAETSSDYVAGMDDEVKIDRLIGTAAYLSPEVCYSIDYLQVYTQVVVSVLISSEICTLRYEHHYLLYICPEVHSSH